MNDTKRFFKAFARDRRVFGEELTIGLYEDVFSFLLNRKITGFDKVSSLINEDGYLETGLDEDYLTEGILDKISGFFKKPRGESLLPSFLDQALAAKDGKTVDKLAGNLDKMLQTPMGKSITDAAKDVGKNIGAVSGQEFTPGVIEFSDNLVKNAAAAANGASGFSTWISNAFSSIKNFFQGGTIKNLLTRGMAWITNPTNIGTILGSAGGIVLLTLIIKSLKKRHQLKKFKNLQDFNDRVRYLEKKELKESFEDTDAFDEVREECRTNKRLHNLFYEDTDPFRFGTKKSYLDY